MLQCRLLVAMVFLAGCGAAGVHASENDALLLSPGVDPGVVNTSIWWLDDPDGSLILEDVRVRSTEFRPNQDDIFNPGDPTSVYWVRIDVANVEDEDGDWIISLNRYLLETCEVFFVSNGHSETLLENSPASFRKSYERFQTLAAHFHLQSGESGQIFIRYRGANWSGLQLSVHAQEEFESSRLVELSIFLVLLGAIGTLVLYGSISFMFMGAQIVLLYTAAQIALFISYAHISGFTTVYLWPGNPQAGRIVAPIALMTFTIAMAQFARLFFETARRTPAIDRILLASVIAGIVAIIASPLDYIFPGFDRRIPLWIIYATSILTWITMPLLAIHATRRWHLDYWPLAFAWTSMATFMITLQLIWLGIVSTLPFGKNSYGGIVLTEAFFVALAIALRIRTLKVEALKTQRRLNESLEAQLAESQRATQFAEEREWALQDLAEKGRLLLAAGHDTRQMLSGLRNYAAGLRMGVDAAGIEQVSRDIEQIATSLNEVLTSAVEGSHSGGITDHALALDTLTASSILGPLELIHGHDAQEAGLELRIRKSDQLLVTDRVLVLRILGNLLTNAIKYTATGKILIGHRSFSGRHRFQVWDTGRGIEEDSLRHLLEPHTGTFRLQDDGDGIGAGIGIAQKLAERLGGRIHGRSTVGKGSVFELILPRAEVGENKWGGSERIVILLDTDPEQTLQIKRLGGVLGVEVKSTDSAEGAEHLLRANSNRQRLILIDQECGGPSDVMDSVQVMASALDVPIVGMTHDRSAEMRANLAHVSNLILYRPVSAMALYAAFLRLQPEVLDSKRI